jgi:hypothetical protein
MSIRIKAEQINVRKTRYFLTDNLLWFWLMGRTSHSNICCDNACALICSFDFNFDFNFFLNIGSFCWYAVGCCHYSLLNCIWKSIYKTGWMTWSNISELNLQASVVNLTGITRYLFDNLCHLSLKLGQLGKLFGLFITSIWCCIGALLNFSRSIREGTTKSKMQLLLLQISSLIFFLNCI